MPYTVERIEIKDGRGVKWSATRNYDGSYDCYKDGMSAFDLTLDDGLWALRNNAPRAVDYKTRGEYLSALANGTHVSPIIGTTTTTEFASLDRLLMWAVTQWKHRGWVTKDCFSDSMATKRAYPAMTCLQRNAVRDVLDRNAKIKFVADKYAVSPSTIRRWMDRYQEIGA